nr:hypothetical protein [Tanacetum cinerariifolium]
ERANAGHALGEGVKNQLHDFAQLAEVARHAKHAFGNHQNAAAGFVGEALGALQLLLEVLDIVVRKHEALALVQAHTVDDAGVRLGVVHDGIVAAHQRVDDAHHALVTEVEQQRGGLIYKLGQLVFELLVQRRVAAHNAGAHGVHRGRPGALRGGWRGL